MSFQFNDSMIADYRMLGYVIFRGIIPPTLLTDLRRATSRAPDLARAAHGGQAQRLQPVVKHLNEDELAPLRKLLDLPELNQAVHRVLSPRHELSGNRGIERLGLLLEPAGQPYCTAWHRDLRETMNVPDVEHFRRVSNDPLFFNQFNCPLYEDNCTWYVPGSYLRSIDLSGESAVGPAPVFADGATDEERERACIEYCRKMPGAMRAQLDAGDFMLYHAARLASGKLLAGAEARHTARLRADAGAD
jgi:hypothetical protein